MPENIKSSSETTEISPKDLSKILDKKDPELLRELFEELPSALIAEELQAKNVDEIVEYFTLRAIRLEDRARVFTYLTMDTQLELFDLIQMEDFTLLFESMYSDHRADLYQEFKPEEQVRLLPYLSKKIKESVMELSAYPPETAGGIMNTDFATIFLTMNVGQALDKVRLDAPSQKMIYYIYVVDHDMKLLGMVTIKDLIMNDRDCLIQDLFTDHIVFTKVSEDREQVASLIEKYDLVAIPVVNHLSQLVGIVGHEEAIDIIRAEHTEDMEKFMGIVPSEDEDTYLSTSTFEHFSKRVGWLTALAAVGLISGFIIHHYQSTLEKILLLAIYMPMMTATGGNTGAQAATVVIRAIALQQAQTKDWYKIMFKELKISCLLSICVALLIFIKINYLTNPSETGTELSLLSIASAVSLAIACQVISSALIGAGLPLLVNKIGLDPAIAASPAITTTVDITGLLIYFNIVNVII